MQSIYPNIDLNTLETLLHTRFEEGFLSLKELPSPHLFKDMQKATERIVSAIKSNQKIVIVGDYDVDGVVSTSIVKLFFEQIGYEVGWIIPNRFLHGYGISEKIVPLIKAYDLAITVDNGISAYQAALLCQEHQIDLIITDHHLLPPLLPDAYAIINPKQSDCDFPYKEICGAQVAWYLIASLKKALGTNIDMLEYLELVSVAIIADVMPLKNINRLMVIAGLQKLERSTKPAMRVFFESKQLHSIKAEDIAFGLAPLLNSAGRMDDASCAVDFLTATTQIDATVLFVKLNMMNEQRKNVEFEITQEALKQAKEREEKILVLSGKAWHEGVVGIVAARVAEYYKKPTIILNDNGEGGLKGSGRSFYTVDLFKTVTQVKHFLDKFGGHKAAIGLSLQKESLEAFKFALQECMESIDIAPFQSDPLIVGHLSFDAISQSLIALMAQFEPYGEGNERPRFITTNVKVIESQTIGKEKNHLRLLLEHSGVKYPAIWFNTTETYAPMQMICVVYHLNENNFQGKRSIQLFVLDIIKPSE